MYFPRRTFVGALGLLLAACSTPKEFSPKDLPPPVPLQDPPAGKAIVYLLRAPHDSATLPVYFHERKVAVLPPGTYTAVVVQPASYAVASSPHGRSESAPASILTVGAGERRFLYVSAATGRTTELGGVLAIRGIGVVPLLMPTYGSAGARTWKECSELDAQGFMSIARPVSPEPGAT